MARRIAVALLGLAVLASTPSSAFAGQSNLPSPTDPRRPAPVEQWLKAVLNHRPGEADDSANLVASWSDDDVRTLQTRSDAVVYGVTVQTRAKPEFLRDLTTATGGRLFEVEKTANLRSIFLSVLEEFRHRYLLSYTPRGVATGGWHTLEVRLKNRKATIKARPGYLAGE